MVWRPAPQPVPGLGILRNACKHGALGRVFRSIGDGLSAPQGRPDSGPARSIALTENSGGGAPACGQSRAACPARRLAWCVAESSNGWLARGMHPNKIAANGASSAVASVDRRFDGLLYRRSTRGIRQIRVGQAANLKLGF